MLLNHHFYCCLIITFTDLAAESFLHRNFGDSLTIFRVGSQFQDLHSTWFVNFNFWIRIVKTRVGYSTRRDQSICYRKIDMFSLSSNFSIFEILIDKGLRKSFIFDIRRFFSNFFWDDYLKMLMIVNIKEQKFKFKLFRFFLFIEILASAVTDLIYH